MTRYYDVTHSDGHAVEVVRRLDFYTARRLVEHELNAGRSAYMLPTTTSRGIPR